MTVKICIARSLKPLSGFQMTDLGIPLNPYQGLKLDAPESGLGNQAPTWGIAPNPDQAINLHNWL